MFGLGQLVQKLMKWLEILLRSASCDEEGMLFR